MTSPLINLEVPISGTTQPCFVSPPCHQDQGLMRNDDDQLTPMHFSLTDKCRKTSHRRCTLTGSIEEIRQLRATRIPTPKEDSDSLTKAGRRHSFTTPTNLPEPRRPPSTATSSKRRLSIISETGTFFPCWSATPVKRARLSGADFGLKENNNGPATAYSASEGKHKMSEIPVINMQASAELLPPLYLPHGSSKHEELEDCPVCSSLRRVYTGHWRRSTAAMLLHSSVSFSATTTNIPPSPSYSDLL